MSPGTNDQGLKLPVSSKKTGIRDEKLLLDMNIQLREADDGFDLSVRFEKLKIMEFTGYILENLLRNHSLFAGHKEQVSDDRLSVNGKDYISLDKINRIKALSVRQREIFEKLLNGLNNNQIADEMKLTVSTVKSHLQEVYLKLNVPNRFVAIARYRELFEKFKKLSSE